MPILGFRPQELCALLPGESPFRSRGRMNFWWRRLEAFGRSSPAQGQFSPYSCAKILNAMFQKYFMYLICAVTAKKATRSQNLVSVEIAPYELARCKRCKCPPHKYVEQLRRRMWTVFRRLDGELRYRSADHGPWGKFPFPDLGSISIAAGQAPTMYIIRNCVFFWIVYAMLRVRDICDFRLRGVCDFLSHRYVHVFFGF